MGNYNHPFDFLSEAMNIYKEGHLESSVYVACIAEEEFVKDMDFIGIVACMNFIEAVREKIDRNMQGGLALTGRELTSESLRTGLLNRCNTNNLKEILNEFNRPLTPSLRNRVISYFEVNYEPFGSEAIQKKTLTMN